MRFYHGTNIGQVKTLGGGDHGFGFLLHPQKKVHEKDKNPRKQHFCTLSVGLEPTIP